MFLRHLTRGHDNVFICNSMLHDSPKFPSPCTVGLHERQESQGGEDLCVCVCVCGFDEGATVIKIPSCRVPSSRVDSLLGCLF